MWRIIKQNGRTCSSIVKKSFCWISQLSARRNGSGGGGGGSRHFSPLKSYPCSQPWKGGNHNVPLLTTVKTGAGARGGAFSLQTSDGRVLWGIPQTPFKRAGGGPAGAGNTTVAQDGWSAARPTMTSISLDQDANATLHSDAPAPPRNSTRCWSRAMAVAVGGWVLLLPSPGRNRP